MLYHMALIQGNPYKDETIWELLWMPHSHMFMSQVYLPDASGGLGDSRPVPAHWTVI